MGDLETVGELRKRETFFVGDAPSRDRFDEEQLSFFFESDFGLLMKR